MTEHESACARVASQFPQRWLRGYVESKLKRDPIYQSAFDLFRPSVRPILDLGCGLGLLAFYLRERGCTQPFLGIDLDEGKIRQGIRIARRDNDNVEFCCQDVQLEIPAFAGDVVLFDLVHYLPPQHQRLLLFHLQRCVLPGGTLVLRDCLREPGTRFWMTFAAEKLAQFVSWNLKTSLHFPTREQIRDAFDETEFEREMKPLWGKFPFNNYLFVFRKK